MGFILTKIKEVPDERIKCFLRVILSSIIRDVSQQEPTDLRIRRRKQPIDDAPVLEMYMEALEKQYGNIMSFYKIRNYAPYRIGCASVWRGNATRADNVRLNLPAGGVDIVITSPPYATALPYIDTNRLNMLVLSGINASMRVPIEAEMTGTREINKSTRVYYEQKIEQQCFDGISSPLAKDIIRKIYEQRCEKRWTHLHCDRRYKNYDGKGKGRHPNHRGSEGNRRTVGLVAHLGLADQRNS